MSATLVAVIAVVMMAEYLNAPLARLPAAPAASTDADRWLRNQAAAGAVLYLPLSLDKDNTVAMVRSLAHHIARSSTVIPASGRRFHRCGCVCGPSVDRCARR